MILDPVTVRTERNSPGCPGAHEQIQDLRHPRRRRGPQAHRDHHQQGPPVRNRRGPVRVAEIMTKDGPCHRSRGDEARSRPSRCCRSTRSRSSPWSTSTACSRASSRSRTSRRSIKHPHACKDEHGRLRVGAAVGVTADTLERVAALWPAGVDLVIVDTAHGHSRGVIEMVKRVRRRFPRR